MRFSGSCCPSKLRFRSHLPPLGRFHIPAALPAIHFRSHRVITLALCVWGRSDVKHIQSNPIQPLSSYRSAGPACGSIRCGLVLGPDDDASISLTDLTFFFSWLRLGAAGSGDGLPGTRGASSSGPACGYVFIKISRFRQQLPRLRLRQRGMTMRMPMLKNRHQQLGWSSPVAQVQRGREACTTAGRKTCLRWLLHPRWRHWRRQRLRRSSSPKWLSLLGPRS